MQPERRAGVRAGREGDAPSNLYRSCHILMARVSVAALLAAVRGPAAVGAVGRPANIIVFVFAYKAGNDPTVAGRLSLKQALGFF